MKKEIGFAKIILSVATVGIALGVMGTGVSYAAFWSKKSVTQTTGYQGPVHVYPIFLDTNGSGNSGWEKDGAVFYMYAYNSGDASFAWVAATSILSAPIYNSTLSSVSHTYAPLYYFRFDSGLYTHFNFVRFNPNGTVVPSWNRDDSPQSLWDQTPSMTYSSSTNLYHINSSARIANGDGFGHETATCTGNASKINEDSASNKLYFMA